MTIRSNRQGLKTKEKLIQAATKCLLKEGVHQISFQSIADKSGLAQPLVVYHFKSKENIFPEVWNSIYQDALRATESALSKVDSAKERLLNYMNISIEIFSSTSDIKGIYFQLHYLAMFDSSIKQINTQVKRKAVNRIAAIILDGQRTQEFLPHIDPYLVAKAIHSSLVGILFNSITEFEDFELKQIVNTFKNRILDSLTK
jgi:AcrR family transcriptional regulator